ncbi:hypothetical protein H4R21_001727, partial [Coemansia helicoidea]
MGVRERTDANLQLVSLGCAVTVVLALAAARRYTGDWRERRGFRRQLAATQKRLTAGPQTEQRRQQRRKWKRFVAAAPLAPLVAAYIAVRVGWGVFEVLVFSAIDVLCDTAAGLRPLPTRALAWAAAAWRRMDARRRAEAAVVAVVVGTVGRLLAAGLPALTRGAAWTRRWIRRAGPAFGAAAEAAVLCGL